MNTEQEHKELLLEFLQTPLDDGEQILQRFASLPGAVVGEGRCVIDMVNAGHLRREPEHPVIAAMERFGQYPPPKFRRRRKWRESSLHSTGLTTKP